MEGILRKIELKEFKTKEGKKFKKVVFSADILLDNNQVITRTGSYGEDFAREYFGFCNVKTKDLIGKYVNVVLAKKTFEDNNGNKRVYEYIKYLNVLDEKGKPIIMPREDTQELDF